MSKLEQAIKLAQAGDKQAARKLLGQVLIDDPDNKPAWEWLARCTSVEEAQRYWKQINAPAQQLGATSRDKSSIGFIRMVGLLLMLLVVAMFAMIMLFSNRPGDDSAPLIGDSDYVIFYVEDMPCLYLDQSSRSEGRTGITCDWSKWHGPQDGD